MTTIYLPGKFSDFSEMMSELSSNSHLDPFVVCTMKEFVKAHGWVGVHPYRRDTTSSPMLFIVKFKKGTNICFRIDCREVQDCSACSLSVKPDYPSCLLIHEGKDKIRKKIAIALLFLYIMGDDVFEEFPGTSR